MSHGIHTTKDGDQRARVVAAAVLGAAAIGVWWPILGAGVGWGVVILAVAVWIIARGPAPRSPRMRIGIHLIWPAWVVLAVLLVGISPSVFSPGQLGATWGALNEGLVNLGIPGASNVWTTAAWLAASGAAWIIGANQAARPHRSSVALAFFMLALPFATALLLRRAEDAPWQGAVILAAALLWATRSELRGALPAVAGVALVALVVSALIGPSERMLAMPGQGAGRSGATGLSSQQTYGPLKGERTGATMFEITSPKAALWRMDTLSRFSGAFWTMDPLPLEELKQPAAVATTTRVRIADLRETRLAAPGRIMSGVTANAGPAAPVPGEGAAFSRSPRNGETYTVISEVVDPPRSALEKVRVPQPGAYQEYTELPGVPPMSAAAAAPPGGQANAGIGWRAVANVVGQITAGTDSQLEIVERVDQYLTQSGTFRYSTKDVPAAGLNPLLDFLTVSRVGYCQHFAGAAALLLRMAGVPTRVAVGFATGTPKAADTYEVTDKEAHAWIEVYFADVGWVPFNPTPASAEAEVASDVGVPPPKKPDASAVRTDRQTPTAGIVLLVLFVVGGLVALIWQRLRKPGEAGPLSEVLVRLVPAPAGPDLTLTQLRADLTAIGPTVAALADQAESQRFGTTPMPPEAHPRRRVLRALVKDIGVLRTAKLLVLGPGRRPVVDEEAAAIIAASVAPPGVSAAPPGHA